MVIKMTIKNQVTIPKKILEQAGLVNLNDEERYFDVEVSKNSILFKPVTLTIEERIPEKQWQKFEDWATKTEKGDISFNSGKKATEFLKKRIKKSEICL